MSKVGNLPTKLAVRPGSRPPSRFKKKSSAGLSSKINKPDAFPLSIEEDVLKKDEKAKILKK